VAPDREPDPSASREDDAVEILTFDFIPGYAKPRARRGLRFRAPKWADRDTRRRWPPPTARQLALGLVLAVVTGAGVGLWAKPDLVGRGDERPATGPEMATVSRPRLAMAVRQPSLPALAPPNVTDAPRRQAAPDRKAIAGAPPPRTAPAAARQTAQPQTTRITPDRPAAAASPGAAPRSSEVIQSAALPAPQAAYDNGEAEGPSFDCRYARSRAEDMVCADPGLARADRVLERSYARAVAFGVPRRMLRDEQDDWLAIRESAARYSRSAVADVYRQRIRELNAMADGRVE
jgi:uncharacterized protein YecT (DUF1311 family)